MRLFFCMLVFVALPMMSAAAPVGIELRLVQEPAETTPISLCAFSNSTEGKQSCRTLKNAGTAVLDLEQSETWTVEASAPGYWPASITVLQGADPAQTRLLTLWPTATIKGRIVVDDKATMPAELRVSFEPATGTKADASFPVDDLTCPITDGSWQCALPAGSLDLKVRATGFVSHYLWQVELAAGKVQDLGTFTLKQGSSIVGWVEIDKTDAKLEDCMVELSPLAGSSLGEATDLKRRQKLTTPTAVTDRGFFHFTTVKPGAYVVTARYQEMVARFFPVMVLKGAESALIEPIRIEKPATLEVVVEPATDPWHRDWRARLWQQGADPQHTDEVGPPTQGASGYFELDGLTPGRYSLSITDQDNNRWSRTELTLVSGVNSRTIEVPLIPVHGTVSLGEEPVQAVLWFGGAYGAVRVRMESDAQGEFEGHLPREGRWITNIKAIGRALSRNLGGVEVHKREGSGIAEVEIVLPDTALHGEVVTEEGEPVPGARVKITFGMDQVEEIPVPLFCDGQGRFELEGLAPGELYLEAVTPTQRSSSVVVHLAEGEIREVQLVVQETSTLRGQVVGPMGGIPGAEIIAFPMGQPGRSLRTRTDVTGSFTLDVPAWAQQLSMVVMAPGFGLRLLRQPVAAEEPMTITVDQRFGTVLLDLNVRPQTSGKIFPLLFENQAFVAIPPLRRWATINGGPPPQDGVLTVPSMAAGDYALCWLTADQVVPLIISGATPPGACTQPQTLLPGAVLRVGFTSATSP